MKKIWNKPLHKRKLWKQMSLRSKIIYYMRPFVENITQIWLEPLPFPTIFKILYSGVLSFFLTLPITYPTVVILCYFGIVQYFVESTLAVRFPHQLDLVHRLEQVFSAKIPQQRERFLLSNIEKCRNIVAAIASCVDYSRLAFTLFVT